MTSPNHDPIAGLRAEIDEVGQRSERRFDPGARAMWISVAVLVLLIAATLPWVQSTSGWEVLFGAPVAAKVAGLAPRVFLAIAVFFGVFGSAVALLVRRYPMAWFCELGADVSVLFGVLSIWSQQTTSSHAAGPGPSAGLILAVIDMIVLAFLWASIVWKKTPAPPARTPREVPSQDEDGPEQA